MKIRKTYICPNCGNFIDSNYSEEAIGYTDNIRCKACSYSSIERDFVKTVIIPENKTKQCILITESNGNANIEWNAKSLEEVKVLLQHSLEFIEKKITIN